MFPPLCLPASVDCIYVYVIHFSVVRSNNHNHGDINSSPQLQNEEKTIGAASKDASPDQPPQIDKHQGGEGRAVPAGLPGVCQSGRRVGPWVHLETTYAVHRRTGGFEKLEQIAVAKCFSSAVLICVALMLRVDDIFRIILKNINTSVDFGA